MKFNEKLKKAMQRMELKQAQVAGLTGCSRAAVSQYLSGINIPPKDKQRDIAVSLGLAPDYFDDDDPLTVKIAQKGGNGSIRRLAVSDAAKLLGMNHNTVRKGLQQGVFPWGYAIHTSENCWVYFINADRFAEIERIGM